MVGATVSLLLLLLGLCTAHKVRKQLWCMDPTEKEDITTTILRMNNGSSEFLLEGDLYIPKTRNAMKCLNKAFNCLWPKSSDGKVWIPYIISDKYDAEENDAIVTAMKDFHGKTCIRFRPREEERMYLSFQPRQGCFSAMGRVGEKQVVSLQRFGCVNHGVIQHELLHALGFYHEHTRSDRDDYITILWENIIDHHVYNFNKKDTINLDTPYDYSSIMHYGRDAFGMNRKETLIPYPDSSVEIGQRDGMSEIDVLRVNRLYKCHGY
ncbi:low choriolytic enzyme-like [Takifugu flavidus]|uniref:low choriolytic enzyme-like n=1 Tax=Takifugu flavidus TaxID=433684 RepID=UPI002544B817|nr:low choriolytic enzyme-like [Takifugu flavidus]